MSRAGSSSVQWGRRILFLLPWLLLLAGCSHPALPQEHAVPAWQDLQIGLCEDYPAESRTAGQVQADLALLKTNHIRYLRTAIAWDALEPEQGKFDWEFLDTLVRTAEADGITLIPYVCYTPSWAARDTNAPWTQPPRQLSDYAHVVRQLAARYKGRIYSWEIWNEPDNREYWSGTPEEYAELLKAGSRAVRESDPAAKVVCGGLAWNLQFLRTLLEQPGVIPAIDVVNLHSYYETWSDDPVEDIDRHVNGARKIMEKAGAPQPIWLAEVGYSTYRTNNDVSYSYQATYRYEHTPEFQAVTIFRMLVPVMAHTKVPLAAWYRIHDLPAGQNVIGDVNNRYLGIVFTNSQPKPAMPALLFFKWLFGEGFANVDSQLRLTAPVSSEAQVHGFVRRDGSLALIAWLPVVEPDRPPPTPSDSKPSRVERLSVSIPPGFELAGTCFNPEGTPISSVRADSKTRTAQLVLHDGDPQIIVFQKSR